MRKLVVTCTCGQRMQVSRSAYGKYGICPKCGQKSRIGSSNSQPMPLPDPGDTKMLGYDHSLDSELARERFGHAVDLYYQQRFAEALAILEELDRQYPGNQEIGEARRKCIEKFQLDSVFNEGRAPKAEGDNGALSPEAIKSSLYRLMTHGASEDVRLRATELACRVLHLLTPEQAAEAQSVVSTEESGPVAGKPDCEELVRD